MSAPATTRRTSQSPRLAPEAHGVVIAQAEGTAWIHGAFRIPWREAEAIEAPRHRAIVLVVSSPSGHAVISPFREQILCEDDEEATSGGAFGWFNLDVAALLGGAQPRDCHILVSLGGYASNVIRATLG